jgi:hypothetical protein
MTGGVNVLHFDTDGGTRLLSTKHGFFGANATTKPEVTGAHDSNAALVSLLSALATLGLITNSSS